MPRAVAIAAVVRARDSAALVERAERAERECVLLRQEVERWRQACAAIGETVESSNAQIVAALRHATGRLVRVARETEL